MTASSYINDETEVSSRDSILREKRASRRVGKRLDAIDSEYLFDFRRKGVATPTDCRSTLAKNLFSDFDESPLDSSRSKSLKQFLEHPSDDENVPFNTSSFGNLYRKSTQS